MALTLATELADYASGIGTQGATLKIDSANKRVGVGTTNPQGPEGSLQVGTGITFFGNTGIISAIGGKFSGDFTVGGTLTYEDVQNVNSSGVGTFSGGMNIVGGGLTVTGVSTFFSNLGINTTNPHHLLTIENAAGAGVANTAILLRNPTTANDSRIGIDFAMNAQPYGGSAWDGASIYVANGGVSGVGSIMTATVESGISSTRTYISHEGKIFIDRETWESDPTTGNHPGLDINTRTTPGNGDTTYATGIDFRVENVHKKRLVVTKGDGSVGDGDWIFYRDHGQNEALRITSGGDVGIGTTNPVLGRLQVERDIGIYRASSDPTLNFAVGGTSGSPTKTYRILIDDDDSDKFQVRDSNTARITLDGSGNVGISSVSPGSVLSVGGDMGLYRSGTQHGTYYIYKDNVATAWFKYRGDTNVVIIGNNADDRLTINPSGGLNVSGITTATQLFEGTSRVATAGKAVAMALVFG